MKLWMGLGAAFVALVIYLSLTPDPVDAGQVGGIKAGHFIAYCWLMFWSAQLLRTGIARISTGVALVLLGAALEFAQQWAGYRSFSYADMRDNGLGVLVGWALGLTSLGGMLGAVERRYGARVAR